MTTDVLKGIIVGLLPALAFVAAYWRNQSKQLNELKKGDRRHEKQPRS